VCSHFPLKLGILLGKDWGITFQTLENTKKIGGNIKKGWLPEIGLNLVDLAVLCEWQELAFHKI
jgi:hypothetical protein